MKWTEADTARLIELCRAGASEGAMATTLKRSKKACERKLESLRGEGIDLPRKNTWMQRRGCRAVRVAA